MPDLRITLSTARILLVFGLAALGCLAGLLLERSLQIPTALVAAPVAGQVKAPGPFKSARIWVSSDKDRNVLKPLAGSRDAIRTVLNISRPMHFGAYVWNEDSVPPGGVWLRIDLTKQILSVFRGGHEIASTVIIYGTQDRPTPLGLFTVLQKDVDHYSRTYNAPMPYMLRLTNDGVAVHGSIVQKGWATHGCIGVPIDFARRLFAITKRGDVVQIVKSQSSSDGGRAVREPQFSASLN